MPMLRFTDIRIDLLARMLCAEKIHRKALDVLGVIVTDHIQVLASLPHSSLNQRSLCWPVCFSKGMRVLSGSQLEEVQSQVWSAALCLRSRRQSDPTSMLEAVQFFEHLLQLSPPGEVAFSAKVARALALCHIELKNFDGMATFT